MPSGVVPIGPPSIMHIKHADSEKWCDGCLKLHLQQKQRLQQCLCYDGTVACVEPSSVS